MGEKPLISVIIPVCNVERYLGECVDSVICQTYSNLEIILVDDGSLDKSGTICEEYSKRDNRIKVYHKENEGLGLTRNFGLKKSHGKYVMFLDPDDYISKNLVEKLAEYTEENNLDLAKSGYIRFNREKILSSNNYADIIYSGKKQVEKCKEKFLGSNPDGKDFLEMGVNASLYKLCKIKEFKLSFVSERKMISEDLIFNYSFLSNSDKVGVTSYLGYYYRSNPASLSRCYDEAKFSRYIEFYGYMIDLAKSDKISESGINRLRKSFFVSLRFCIQQEKHNINKKSEVKRNIGKICKNHLVLESINKYPIKELHFRQRFFLKLIEKGKVQTIYLLLKYGVL